MAESIKKLSLIENSLKLNPFDKDAERAERMANELQKFNTNPVSNAL
jgi:hypothetical protein